MVLRDAPEGKRVWCSACGQEVNLLVGRYLFVRFGWRGRGVGPAPATPGPDKESGADSLFSLCGPCGKRFQDDFGWMFRGVDTSGLERGQGTHQP